MLCLPFSSLRVLSPSITFYLFLGLLFQYVLLSTTVSVGFIFYYVLEGSTKIATTNVLFFFYKIMCLVIRQMNMLTL
jgi:hypothetical protein